MTEQDKQAFYDEFTGEHFISTQPDYADSGSRFIEWIDEYTGKRVEEVGKEFKEWFLNDKGEDIEDTIERITGLKVV